MTSIGIFWLTSIMAVRTKWLAGIEVAAAGIEGHLVLKLGCFVWGSCAFHI
jgi:hypothetical protein